jgi:tetratricopeptide (TPR) repeat protein
MDNYAEETQPLYKLFRTPAFRFVVVRFNHYSLVRRLQNDLRAQFPDRKVSTIDTEKATYQEILKTYLEQEEGFMFLENFEDILKRDADSQGKVTPEMTKNNKRRSSIAAGLNMRRDKLAKSPIAIIVFVFATAGELYVRSLMEKMPDLWSFRSLLLDLKLEQEVATPKIFQMEPQWEPTTVSTLGGTTREEKLAELDRLLNEVKTIPATETNYLKTLYEQIAELQKETGQYEEALEMLDKLYPILTYNAEKIRLQIIKSDILTITGRLNDAVTVLDQASIESTNSGDLFLKSIILQRLGDAFLALGNIDNVISYNESSTILLEKLLENDKQNIDYRHGLTISYGKLGSAYFDLGNIQKAIEYYDINIKVATDLYHSNPQNSDFKLKLAIIHEKLGTLFLSIGDVSKAKDFYEDSFRLKNELCLSFPQNIEYRHGLSISFEKLGNISQVLGKLNDALSFFEKSRNLKLQLYKEYPKNLAFKNGLAISLEKIGSINKSLGNFENAVISLTESFRLFKELYILNPQNVIYKKEVAISFQNLGNIYLKIGDFEQSFKFYEEYNKLLLELFDGFPQNIDFKFSLADSYSRLANIYIYKKNINEAVSVIEKCRELLNELIQSFPQNSSFKFGLADSLSTFAFSMRYFLKDEIMSKDYFLQSEKLLSELLATSPDHADFKKNLEQVQNELKKFD